MTDSSVAARRVALVTGGARGIGRAIAEGLRAIGAAVVVLDADGDALDACGLDGLKIRADIASPDDSAAAVARVCELHGRLDILVNNAGLGMGTIREDHFARPVALAEITPEHWRRMFEVNCMGAFLMMRAAVPGMVTRGWGRVVNITTSFFTMLNQGFAPYGPAKAAALEAASAIWAKEFAGTGVTVNVLIPGGPTDTRMVPRSAPFSRSALIPPAALAARAMARLGRRGRHHRAPLHRRAVGSGADARGSRRQSRRADRLAGAHRPGTGLARALRAG
jgi:NAD(P)-dependent dehydrogenase (short-subunit alcohol dehydrogenase family)